MTKTTLSAAQVGEIVNSIPENLDQDHLAALVLTIVAMQNQDETLGRIVTSLCGMLMTYCRSISLQPEIFKAITDEIARTYAETHSSEVKH
jgi:hypothetical protein